MTGIVRTFDTTWNAAIRYGYLRDGRDGLAYRTVKIGPQNWMAENLSFWGFKSPYKLNGRCYGDLIAALRAKQREIHGSSVADRIHA